MRAPVFFAPGVDAFADRLGHAREVARGLDARPVAFGVGERIVTVWVLAADFARLWPEREAFVDLDAAVRVAARPTWPTWPTCAP